MYCTCSLLVVIKYVAIIINSRSIQVFLHTTSTQSRPPETLPQLSTNSTALPHPKSLRFRRTDSEHDASTRLSEKARNGTRKGVSSLCGIQSPLSSTQAHLHVVSSVRRSFKFLIYRVHKTLLRIQIIHKLSSSKLPQLH